MLLYAITQRSLFAGDETERAAALVAWARELSRGGVPWLQIREKDLSPSALEALAASVVHAVRAERGSMRVLLNGPAAIALNAGCNGIHLGSTVPAEVATAARRLYRQAGRACFISAACHNLDEIRLRSPLADLLLFSPVFGKATSGGITPAAGLSALSDAVTAAGDVPVLALGGVTRQNARACVTAGAAGVAAIRLFQGDDWRSLVQA